MPAPEAPPIAVAPIAAAAPGAIEALLDEAFGADRRRRTAYRIRDGMTALPGLSCAAFAGDALVGTLQAWPVALDGTVPLVLIGPVAVAAARRDAGIGRALVAHAMAAADADGADPLVLIGDPEYYGTFGFDSRWTADWTVPGPVERRRLLARVGPGVALPARGHLGPRQRAIDTWPDAPADRFASAAVPH